MEGKIHTWMAENRENAAKAYMKVENIETEYMNITIGGYMIQVAIPSTSKHSFLAISLQEEGDENFIETLFELNEKLERVRISSDCMTKVLNNIVQVFEKNNCTKPDKITEGGEQLENKSEFCVQRLAEDARVECENALLTCDYDTELVDGILPWCSVNLIPNMEAVDLQMEIKGIMAQDHVSSGLGFCFEDPLIIRLQFGNSEWSATEFSLDIFHSVNVYVKQSPTLARQLGDLMEKLPVELDARLLNAISKSLPVKMPHYGPQVLVPGFVKEFFQSCRIGTDRLLYAIEHIDHIKNIFVGLLISLGNWMKDFKKWCVVCKKKLPQFSRLWYCDGELWFEEMGIGASVLHELKNSELIDMEITLAAAATRTIGNADRDVFEPYPSFLLKKEEMRQRSGFFGNCKVGGITDGSNAIKSGEAISSEAENSLANKNLDLLKQIIDSFPPLSEMQQYSNEIELVLKLGISWLQKDCKHDSISGAQLSEEECAHKMLLPYKILTNVLFTNRSSLRILKNSDKLNVQGSLYEFVIFYDSEREKNFDQRRISEGSAFAFHGSSTCNWYSIIRNGLKGLSKTKYMSAGNAYGDGIYLSTDMKYSYYYCHPSPLSENEKSKDYRVMAICEIFSWKSYKKKFDTLVIPNENDVIIRYLIVFSNYDPNWHRLPKVIGGYMLAGKTNLGRHYKQLRRQYTQEVISEGLIPKERRLELIHARRNY